MKWLLSLIACAILSNANLSVCEAQLLKHIRIAHGCGCRAGQSCAACSPSHVGGSWQWMESPSEQHRVVASLYNRYCVRCHGVDGRGVWDIPDVPNFADAVWQQSRTDEQLARLTMEGRGAVMPAFRGTFTWDESWAMARYLRSFVDVPKPTRPPRNQSNSQATPANSAPAGETHVFPSGPILNPAFQSPTVPIGVQRLGPPANAPFTTEQRAGIPSLGDPVMPNGFRLSHIAPVSGNVSPPAFSPPGFAPPASSRPLQPVAQPSAAPVPQVATRVFAPRAEPTHQLPTAESSQPTTKPRPFPPVSKPQLIPIGSR